MDIHIGSVARVGMALVFSIYFIAIDFLKGLLFFV